MPLKNNAQCLFSYQQSPGPEVQSQTQQLADIASGKTGQDLPVVHLCTLDPTVFAAFTGPDGGITSLKGQESENDSTENSHPPDPLEKRMEGGEEEEEELDYIDLGVEQGRPKIRTSSKIKRNYNY